MPKKSTILIIVIGLVVLAGIGLRVVPYLTMQKFTAQSEELLKQNLKQFEKHDVDFSEVSFDNPQEFEAKMKELRIKQDKKLKDVGNKLARKPITQKKVQRVARATSPRKRIVQKSPPADKPQPKTNKTGEFVEEVVTEKAKDTVHRAISKGFRDVFSF